jgi:hypothetical protein
LYDPLCSAKETAGVTNEMMVMPAVLKSNEDPPVSIGK